ncbi:hypothetical protein BH11VER1_BH11VER1_19740 [soil metagenome]
MNSLMNVILICPEHRPVGGHFQRIQPLALMPLLGRSLLEHSLTQLAKEGARRVLILASDRPARVREAMRDAAVWGLEIEVLATSSEIHVHDAAILYANHFTDKTRPTVMLLDRCPLLLGSALWQSSEGNFELFREKLASNETVNQLTMREVIPGVWVSTKATVSPDSQILAPAWIGPRASIAEGACVGPHAIVEAGAFIDTGASVVESWVGPDTYVGSGAIIESSMVWGNGLTNWRNGSFVEVHDEFLISDISRRTASQRSASLTERTVAFALMVVTLPLAVISMLRNRLQNLPVFNERRVILPPPYNMDRFSRTHSVLTLAGETSMLQRWPELWRVVCGDLALVGNRPLSLEAASSLRGQMAENWLKYPAGVFSLADTENVDGENVAESMPYAAFFTARRNLLLRLTILCRCLRRLLASPSDEALSAISTPLKTV